MKFILENPVYSTGILVVAAIVIIGFVIGGEAKYDILKFLPTSYDAVVNVLTPIFLIALLVERTVEVFVGTGRKIGRAELDSKLQKAEEKVEQLKERMEMLQAQFDAPGAANLTPEEKAGIEARRVHAAQEILPEALRTERDARADIEVYRNKTGRITFFAGAFVGLIIGIAGIRVIAPMVDIGVAPWTPVQAILFHSLDVVLTAGLLAGGASGIHQILSTFGEFTEKTRRAAKKA